MPSLALAVAALALAAAPSVSATRPGAGVSAISASDHAAFDAWAAEHGRSYGSERDAKVATFVQNREFIDAENAKGLSYTLGLNAFADLTWEEFRVRLSPLAERAPSTLPFTHASVDLASANTTTDWRKHNAVTEVKNQGQCGSCWAFSTTGSIEGAIAVSNGTLTALSEQELVACDTEQDQGCNGGLMDYAFAFVQKEGLASEKEYPYTSSDGNVRRCKAKKEKQAVAHITGFTDVPASDEKALMKAVSQQPVSVAIEADQQGFQFYTSGVFSGECGTALDHGVLAVGYSDESDDGKGFWIVKNSWGATWGEDGYIRLAMGKGKDGQCGIAMQASYPTA